MKPQKYVKQPVTIEAMLWDGTPEGATPIINWILGHDGSADYFAPGEWDEGTDSTYIRVRTLEGNMIASPGDYIIRGIRGEFYPCKPDIFRRTYTPESETGSWREYYAADLSEPVSDSASGTASRTEAETLLEWVREEFPDKTFTLLARTVTATPWKQADDE